MSCPIVSGDFVCELISSLFDITAAKNPKNLGSCQDLNFRIDCEIRDNSTKYCVAKISNLQTNIEDIRLQNNIMKHLSAHCSNICFPFPQNLKNSEVDIGNFTYETEEYNVRLLTYLDGNLLSDFRTLNSFTLEGIGRFLANLNSSLSQYRKEFKQGNSSAEWDMKNTYMRIGTCIEILNSCTDRQFFLNSCTEMNSIISKHSEQFQSQIIHGDLAHYNLIAARDEADHNLVKVTGVIDFGDVTYSWLVGDLAIAIVPLFDRDDRNCLLFCMDVLRGYMDPSLTGYKLSAAEVYSLWPLIYLRSVLLVVSIMLQIQLDNDNEYCKKEIVLNIKILEKVVKVPLYAAQVHFLTFNFYLLPHN
jgi:Ser/Thr protein kinase RdoA (MazF antagonist)